MPQTWLQFRPAGIYLAAGAYITHSAIGGIRADSFDYRYIYGLYLRDSWLGGTGWETVLGAARLRNSYIRDLDLMAQGELLVSQCQVDLLHASGGSSAM